MDMQSLKKEARREYMREWRKKNPEKLREIGLAAKALGVPNACSHITDELLDLYKTHRK